MFIPVTVTEAPVDDRLLMVSENIFTAVELLAEAKAVTAPPVPVDDKPVMVLPFTFRAVAFPAAPIVIPVIAACPVMVDMVLPAIAEVFPKPVTVIAVIAPVPAVQFEKVLLEMVFDVNPASN